MAADRLLIGEIGGSASRWALLQGELPPRVFPAHGESLPGYNPLSGDGRLFAEALLAYFTERCPEVFHAANLEVYAAGCGTAEHRALMRGALSTLWPSARIAVDSDLVGAARGLCGASPGLVLILGTGMNAGWYDGTALHQPMPSLGWILGDEGSGADIGRTLLRDAFYKRMPADVSLALFGDAGPDLEEVLREVHRSPFPARALAARTALLVPLMDQPYVRELVSSRFHAMAGLLTTFFPPERREAVHATGSVAWGFRELLAECLLERGMALALVERDPLPGLVRRSF